MPATSWRPITLHVKETINDSEKQPPTAVTVVGRSHMRADERALVLKRLNLCVNPRWIYNVNVGTSDILYLLSSYQADTERYVRIGEEAVVPGWA